MSNLKLYDAVRSVPENAKKQITGGRLNGKTDINPMWRIKTLTEQFGPCGIGWKPVIKKSWLEKGANGEIAAFVEIDLFIKYNGEWSEAIPGTGGSMFVEKEKSGLYTSDECFKMAYTDAISVACKALGIGANVYWEKDSTKYDKKPDTQSNPTTKTGRSPDTAIKATKEQIAEIFRLATEHKQQVTNFDIFKHLEEMENDNRISTRYPYADKSKTKINWTVADYEAIKSDMELPF
jgi:hypothetical protein